METKTPEQWCEIKGIYILDPDGWRGAGGTGFCGALAGVAVLFSIARLWPPP